VRALPAGEDTTRVARERPVNTGNVEVDIAASIIVP
jgi:hypothetical protein